MTTADLANGLVDKVRRGDYEGAIDSYYHRDIVSIEPAGDPREVVGADACRKKAEWWNGTFQVHGSHVEGPFVAGEKFVVRFVFDVTNKSTGVRSTMDELALYQVEGSRIVREQFFYHAPGL
ncbi:MAG: SnoaL-like domain-containing protein [Gemmatimonadales bacterium]